MVKVSVLPERAGEKDALKRLACRHELEGVKDDGIIGTLDIGAQKPFAGLVKASLACAKNAEQIKKADANIAALKNQIASSKQDLASAQADKEAYDKAANKLAAMFQENFAKKYPNMPANIVAAGPKAK